MQGEERLACRIGVWIIVRQLRPSAVRFLHCNQIAPGRGYFVWRSFGPYKTHQSERGIFSRSRTISEEPLTRTAYRRIALETQLLRHIEPKGTDRCGRGHKSAARVRRAEIRRDPAAIALPQDKPPRIDGCGQIPRHTGIMRSHEKVTIVRRRIVQGCRLDGV